MFEYTLRANNTSGNVRNKNQNECFTYLSVIDFYISYMDDLIIIDSNKDRLVNVLESIKLELIKYKLKINSKSRIYSLNHEFNFLYKNNLDKFYRSLASYNGLFLGCNIDKYKYFVII